MLSEIDTTNYGLVSVDGIGDIVFLRPLPQKISKALALSVAAWLVAIADDDDKFDALLEAIKAT